MNRKNILLLIDDDGLERVITLMLRQADFEVIAGSDAGMLMENLRGNRKPGKDIDAVISCLQQSGSDGREAISLLGGNYRPTPVMAIIPYGSEQDIAGLRENGCTAILHSPFESDELMKCLNGVLNSNRQ